MSTLYTHLCTYQIVITGIAETKQVFKKSLPLGFVFNVYVDYLYQSDVTQTEICSTQL